MRLLGALPMIRDYQPTDRAAIRACIVELQEFERGIDERLRPGESMATAYLEHMLARCASCAGTILVAELDGAVAGFATTLTRVPFESLDDPPGEYALVSDLVVRDSYRRQGVGRALLEAATERARTAGAVELRIGVMHGNVAAARLYRSAGFTPYLEILTKRV